MEPEEVGAILGRCTLHAGFQSHDNGSCTIGEYVFLMPGKDIGHEKEQHHEHCPEETQFLQCHTPGEKIDQEQHNGQEQHDERCPPPGIDTHQVDHGAIPGDQKEVGAGRQLVNRLLAGQLQVVAYVAVAWFQEQGTLIVQNGPRIVVGTIVGIAQVIVDVGTDALLQQGFILFDGFLIVLTGIGAVGLSLTHGMGRERHKGQKAAKPKTRHQALYAIHMMFHWFHVLPF